MSIAAVLFFYGRFFPIMQRTTELIADALAHHEAGRLADARVIYGQILQAEPEHPDALHFLGLLACQVRQHEAGIALMRRSIGLKPNAVYCNNFGNALKESGNLEEAIESYQVAIALDANYAQAHNNLGDALRLAGHAQASVESCAKAIELDPGYAQAYNNLGNALRDLNEFDAAASSYLKSIEYQPHYAEAHLNLGNVRAVQGNLDAAIGCCRTAISLKPDLTPAHVSLGNALARRGEIEPAIDSYRRAIDLAPGNAHVYMHLGNAYLATGQLEAAVFCYQRAIKLDPALHEGHLALGMAYSNQMKHEEAVESCKKSIALNAEHAEAHLALARALIQKGDTRAALPSCLTALSLKGDLSRIYYTLGVIRSDLGDLEGTVAEIRKVIELKPDATAIHSSLLFLSSYSPRLSPDAFLAQANRFRACVSDRVERLAHTRDRDRNKGGGRIKVGFVSGDLKGHPVGHFLASVLEHLDPRRLELVAYSSEKYGDELTAQLMRYFSEWRCVAHLNDEALARMVYEHEIDILVDLSGHTLLNRLPAFAWKPAPVQVSWLGFFATTGLDTVDYILGDRHVLPAEESWHFVEKPWRLPDSYLCFTTPEFDVDVGPLPMEANGFVTFGCLNNLLKVNEDVIALWSRVLHAVPDSRLLLKAKQLKDEGVHRETVERFSRHGIARERLILEGQSRRAVHIGTFNRVDIALDPFPYPGGTTSVEGLWMGVPVLTRRGDRFLSHIGESIAHTAGLSDWIAEGDDDYVAKAATFARDPMRLANLRAGLRAQVLASPLFDAPRFARHLEDAFEQMWQTYMAGDAQS